MTPSGPDKHLNLNVRGMGASATVAINERSNALRAEGRHIFKLGLGQSPFPVPEPVVHTLRERAAEKDYLPTQGLRPLREAVAAYTRRSIGIERSAEDILVGPGSKELMFLLQLVFYGDLVIPTPSWVSYAPQARIVGHPIRFIPTRPEDGWRIQPDALQRSLRDDADRPRILILNYPSNPTGGTFSADDLAAIADIARSHRILLLSDEIYSELHHRGGHVSVAGYYPEGTIVSSGLSKWCGAGGWRLGTFVFPPSLGWLREAMTAAASETYTSTSAPIQYAAVTAFEGGAEIDDYLDRSRRVLGALGRWCSARLRAAGVAVDDPAGAFYLFPSFQPFADNIRARGIESSDDLCEALLNETGVAILPGSAFGRPPEELTARMAYVDFDGAAALADSSLPLDEPWLRAHCGEVLTAIDRLCDWL